MHELGRITFPPYEVFEINDNITKSSEVVGDVHVTHHKGEVEANKGVHVRWMGQEKNER